MNGLILTNDKNAQEYLRLPFVPTETNINRGQNWVDINPPGMPGTFAQFTQGGPYSSRLDLFLNDVFPRKEDVIRGQYFIDGEPQEVTNTRSALQWLDVLTNSRFSIDGVYEAPPPLEVTIGGRNTGAFIVKNWSVDIILRHNERALGADILIEPRNISADGATKHFIAGSASRARVTMNLQVYNEIPNVSGTQMRW